MNKRKTSASHTITSADEERLRRGIHALGDYAHVEVHAIREHLDIGPAPDDPVARATPLGGGQYGLSFHSHTGRWERMPVVGNLDEIAQAAVDMLGPHLTRWDFSDRMSDPDH
jgi:hypothetical protein